MEGRNMKSVVITGSARGFGLEMAKVFRSNDYNVVISDILDKELESAHKTLESIPSKGKVLKVKCDVTSIKDLKNLMAEAIKKFKAVDVWINNA